jgi:FHS family L-fucose permease-like MFS transporter
MTEQGRKLALAAEASSVKMPYFILGSVLVIIAVHVSPLPDLPRIQQHEGHAASKNIFHALKHRHLAWGVAAQFFYVGAQVCVFSLFILYATKSAGLDRGKSGRLFRRMRLCIFDRQIHRHIPDAVLPVLPGLLATYAGINIFLCIGRHLGSWHGNQFTWSLASAFFMSIMFPTIFALGIKGLKADTEFGSSLIIMSIVGGAVLPRMHSATSAMRRAISNTDT